LDLFWLLVLDRPLARPAQPAVDFIYFVPVIGMFLVVI